MDCSNDGREADVKVCTCCLTSQPLTAYNKCRGQVDGLQRYCKQCQSKKNKAWMRSNKEKRQDYVSEYNVNNKDKRRAAKHVWDTKNRQHRQNYRLSRKAYYAERASARRSASLNAMPVWLTDEQKQQIQDTYWLAKDLRSVTGEPYHVDHIVPLQGKRVCGLHVPWNLQVIPADINYSKNNHFTD